MSPLDILSSMLSFLLRLIGLGTKPKDVRGECVLITGAGSGLGRLLALRFARLGCRLVLWDINAQGNVETRELVHREQPDVDVYTYRCDVADREDVYRTAKKVKEDVGKVTILVNNAGIVTGKSVLEIPDDSVVKVFQVNTLSHFWTCKAFLPDMIADDHGHIVTVSSMAGLGSLAMLSDYCSSKFAVVGFEECLRLELYINGHTGVKTTLVCPFFMNTGMFEGVSSPYIPILRPEYVADRLVEGVLRDKKVLLIPSYMIVVFAIHLLVPWSVWFKLYCVLGGRTAMNEFVGRQKVKTT